MKLFIALPLFLVLFLSSCKEKVTPACFMVEGVSNCNELFDSIQANLNNPEQLNKLSDCYKAECK